MPLGLLKAGLRRSAPTRFLPGTPELRKHYDVVIVGGGGHGLAGGVLPRQGPRHHERRRAREGLPRRREHRAQHRDRARELPDARGRALLRGVAGALRGTLGRARLQPALLEARPSDARAHRRRAPHHALARRGEQAPGRRLRGRRARGAPAARAVPEPLRGRAVAGARRAPPPARRDRAARRRRVGLRGRRGATRRRAPPADASSSACGPSTAAWSASGRTAARSAAGACSRRSPGFSSRVAKLAGFRLPIRTVPLQACVSQPLKPFLDPIVVSGSLHVYVSQTSRGELVMGGATDPYALHSDSLDARLQGRALRAHARALSRSSPR